MLPVIFVVGIIAIAAIAFAMEAAGKRRAEISGSIVPQASANAPLPSTKPLPRPLTEWDIFWAVFAALWMFAITAGIAYAIVRFL